MKIFSYSFLLLFFFSASFSKEPTKIRIAFEDGFWGTYVSYVKLDTFNIYLEKDTLISEDDIGFADGFYYSTNRDTLVFESEMLHFKDEFFTKYYFSIPIQGAKVVRFFMDVDTCTCKRKMKFLTSDHEYFYD